MKDENKKFKKQSHLSLHKILRNKLTYRDKGLYSENDKMPVKETEDTNRRKKYPMFIEQKVKCCHFDQASQIDLQIQCNPCQYPTRLLFKN